MSITTVERAWTPASVENNLHKPEESTASLFYIVRNAEDELAAISAVREELGDDQTYNDLPIHAISVDDRLTENDWKIEVKFQKQNESNSGGSSNADEEDVYNFDISSGTRRVVIPIKSRSRYPASAPASNGINDGEGVDVMMPVFHFSETHFFSSLSTSKKTKIAACVGCVNSSGFKGYAAGEVLFTGCSGTKTGKDKWSITFSFSVCFNQSGIKVGEISGISKKGWDIMWVRYKESETTVGGKKKIVRTAEAVYVEQVYAEASFGNLGIGS